METREMLVLGRFPRQQWSGIALAAEQAALSVFHPESREEASRWLDSHEPAVVLLDASAPEPTELAIQARAQAAHAEVPILALANEVGDLSFEEAFSFGADDVVGRGRVRSLTARLRALPQSRTAGDVEERGTALVAVTDHRRRILLGRVLRNAGYQVTFAVTSEDLQRFAEDNGFALVVTDDDLAPEPRALLDRVRSAGAQGTWICTSAPKQLRQRQAELEGLDGVCAADGYAPVENILFLANELRAQGIQSRRRSARLLYGTTTAFRGAGLEEDDHGFTYNVSEQGLFVRTMALPGEDTVWLELCPPRSHRRVRLVGEVAWRRRFGPSPYATVPPGFGVRIVDGASRDIEAWQEGYKQLGEMVL
jgi:DNA-binding response OmpR family regulator